MTVNPNWAEEQKINVEENLVMSKTNALSVTKTDMTDDLSVQKPTFE
jgi:hypothetical protein